jgi:hypothetical protein
MLAAQDVATRCKELGITALHIKIRATGGMFRSDRGMCRKWELTQDRKRHQDAGTGRAVGAPCARARGHEDWPDRGRDADTVGLDAQEGWSPR